MEFKICHDPSKKTLLIPRAALQLSGLVEAEELTLHTESGCVVVARDDLTAVETVGLIHLFSELNVSLLCQLAQASQDVMEDDDDPLCRECDRSGCGCLSLPSCLLEQTNIRAEKALITEAESGRIIITTAAEADPLDNLAPDFLAMLVNAGVELDGLRYLLEQGDERDE